jgi:L-lactate dehydrogenase complex protein LldF
MAGMVAAHGTAPALPHAGAHGALRSDFRFPTGAHKGLRNAQLRRNLAHATATIRAKRAAVVGEVPDWEALREAGSALKTRVMANLPDLLTQLEERVTAHGGVVHWARDAEEAGRIVIDLVREASAREVAAGGVPVEQVVKVKSMATQEIGLNESLADAGIAAVETDLAELIVQLADDTPSHILVPAIHRNRAEIRQIFLDSMPDVDPALTDEPRVLAMAARSHLRRTFLAARVAISGANFAVAETGTLAVVESEGNGRMCLTLPDTLITVMGIEKLVPTWRDLEVFLQLLPRSSTGERMNPYTSMWTGVTPGDGPQHVHLVLLDNGRTAVLGDEAGRSALHCIRCSACLNVCPVYERAGGHAYGSVYPGPIGAVLTPQLAGMSGSGHADSLPYASSLCGACYDACPVKIDIPSMLVHLRARHVETAREAHRLPSAEQVAMSAAAWVMGEATRFAAAEKGLGAGRLLARLQSGGLLGGGLHGGRDDARIRALPPPFNVWTAARDVPQPPPETFRQWWARTRAGSRAPRSGAER